MDIDVCDDLDDMAEVDQLIALEARPDPVDDVPPLPPGSSPRLRLVRDDYIRVLGLRRSIDLSDDVIYGSEWVAARVGLSRRHVSRLLTQLVELGVLAEPVEMERMGKQRGTYSYRPGKPRPVPPRAGGVE
jgi:AraC-like DNA-binding protein